MLSAGNPESLWQNFSKVEKSTTQQMPNVIPEVIQTLPIASSFAGLFYTLLLALTFSKRIRSIFARLLKLPTPSNQPQLAALDAFRGIAALGAATFHALQWSSPYFSAGSIENTLVLFGFKSVPVFVILSGFLIYRAASRLSSVEQLANYGRNRFLRVYPLYAATVFASLIFGKFQLNEMLSNPGCISSSDSAFRFGIPWSQHFIAELFMLHGLGFPAFINPPSWSLYTEVLFYMALPFFVFTVRSHRLFAACMGILVFSFTDFSGPREFMLWKYFFFGIVCAEISEQFHRKISQTAGAFLFFIGVGLLYVEIGIGYDWFSKMVNVVTSFFGLHFLAQSTSPAPYFTVGLGFTISLLIIGASHTSFISRFFSFGCWKLLAAISFSLFMWHGFLLVADLPLAFCGNGVNFHHTGPMPDRADAWVLPLIMIPAMLMIAMLSFIMIEKPFLTLRHREVRSPI